MRAVRFSLFLLLLICFSLATDLVGWSEQTARKSGRGTDVLTLALGDSRKLFAQHIYAKADAYYHNGYYPSMFDRGADGQRLRVASQGPAAGEDKCSHLGEPLDWIDRFSRHFFPSEHRHMGEETCEHDHGELTKHADHADHAGESHGTCEHCDHAGHDHGKSSRQQGLERELLPWFRLAAELDPERPETYVVAAYWLRSQLNKPDEAEQFLREGLRSNPGNAEILFELGRIYRENRQDPNRARNIWELALAMARKSDNAGPEPNLLLHAQLLGNLAKLEEEAQHAAKARQYLEALLPISPNKDAIRKWIGELK